MQGSPCSPSRITAPARRSSNMPADASLAAQADAPVCLLVTASDFLFWVGLNLAREQMIGSVLTTPPERVAAAVPRERAPRCDAAATTCRCRRPS